MKIESDDPRWILRYHDSVIEAIDYAVEGGDPKGTSHNPGYHGDWAGDSWDNCVQLARQGWVAARPRVDAILKPVREKLSQMLEWSQEPSFDITGYEPDIPRFLDGELECMVDYMPVEAPALGKVFNLLINGNFNGHVSSERIFQTGAAIAALVESLQILGFDLNIYVEQTTRPGWGGYMKQGTRKYDAHTWLCRVHRAGDNLDINNVMFPIGHPGWLRRIGFAVCEAENSRVRHEFGFTPGGGYGRAVAIECDDMIEASFTLAVDNAPRKLYADPVAWVLEQLEVQGVWKREEEHHGLLS